MDTVIRLRPHHGMCIAYFVGEGYSGSFTENMAAVIRALERDAWVKLVCEGDVICGPCPNFVENGCVTLEKVDRYDAAVLRLCGLEPGQKLPYREFRDLVRENILTPGLRQEICGDCQWNDLCK